jgi:hypothetical protein
MPPLKIFTLTSLLALAIAAPSAFAQGGDNTPPPPRNAPTISPTPGDATAAPTNQQRGAKKKGMKRNRSTDTTKPAPSPSAPSTTPN